MGTRVTEILHVDVEQGCVNNPVYVRWIGSRGGWNYWLFGSNQVLSLVVGNVVTVTRRIGNLSSAQTMRDRIGATSIPTITLGSPMVTREKLWGDGTFRRGLSSMLTSPRVQIWIPDRSSWITALVKPGTFRVIETREAGSDIEMELELPELTIQTQS